MKTKKINTLKLSVLFILIIFTSSYGQNDKRVAYYDAITFAKLYENHLSTKIPINNSDVLKILTYYFPDRTNLQSDLSSNIYLKDYFNTSGGNASLSSSDIDLLSNSLKSVSTKMGGLDVTNISDGLAKFLVERTKQELTVAFFDRFKEVFEDFPEFGLLFPNTQRNFVLIESFNFSAYLNALRIDFYKDLENLPYTLPELENIACVDNDSCKNRKTAYKDFFKTDEGLIFKVLLVLVNDLRNGKNPAEIFTSIANNSDFKEIGKNNQIYFNVKSTIELADFISRSLLSTGTEKTWITGNEIISLVENTDRFKIYLGLLYQLEDSEKIVFKIIMDNGSITNKSFRKILMENYGNLIAVENLYKEIANNINQISLSVENIKTIKKNGLTPEVTDYFQFYHGISNFMKTMSGLEELGIKFESSSKKKVDDIIYFFDTAGSIYQDFASKNYSGAIMDIRILMARLEIDEKASPFLKEFFKYGTFMAAVAEAENSDQVQDAIESIALPAGSATIKKRTKLNVALNAYVGLTGGWENNGTTNEMKGMFGITAPVGIAVSTDLLGKKNNKERGSLSLFVSMIDIGAITNFRFNDDMTENLPEITLENVFAPGIYGIHGWAKLPISWGVGFQYGPQLREVFDDSLDLNSDASWSIRGLIAVDIPLINLYTKSR